MVWCYVGGVKVTEDGVYFSIMSVTITSFFNIAICGIRGLTIVESFTIIKFSKYFVQLLIKRGLLRFHCRFYGKSVCFPCGVSFGYFWLWVGLENTFKMLSTTGHIRFWFFCSFFFYHLNRGHILKLWHVKCELGCLNWRTRRVAQIKNFQVV